MAHKSQVSELENVERSYVRLSNHVRSEAICNLLAHQVSPYYQIQRLPITATRVQILDETDCISHSTNTFGEGMNPIILPPAMGK